MRVVWIVTLVAFCLLGQNKAEPDRSKWTPFICVPTGIFTPNEARIAGIHACGEGQCTYVCQARALGLVHENGTTSLELYNEWTDAVLPRQHNQLAKKVFADCFHKYGQYIDPKDRKCVMSKAYATCTWALLPELKCTYRKPTVPVSVKTHNLQCTCTEQI